MNIPANIFYRPSLVFMPFLVACAMPILGRSWFFVTRQGMPWLAAVKQCAHDLITALQNGGAIATTLYILSNITSFGALIVACLIASYFWNAKRVYCTLLCGIGGTACAWIATSPCLSAVRTGQIPFDLPVLSWTSGIFQYHLIALLAIPLGALIAALPTFKPGRRYWLSRGMCPRCRYDLKGNVNEGCPECGWNRKPDHKRTSADSAT